MSSSIFYFSAVTVWTGVLEFLLGNYNRFVFFHRFFPRLVGLCVSADPATVFTAFEVLGFLKSFAALLATRREVFSFFPLFPSF
jgi:hypothetical protein